MEHTMQLAVETRPKMQKTQAGLLQSDWQFQKQLHVLPDTWAYAGALVTTSSKAEQVDQAFYPSLFSCPIDLHTKKLKDSLSIYHMAQQCNHSPQNQLSLAFSSIL